MARVPGVPLEITVVGGGGTLGAGGRGTDGAGGRGIDGAGGRGGCVIMHYLN
ncbi:MAG: hypothetical protein WBA13_23110 [Microcoleaceae cyanobacterium]